MFKFIGEMFTFADVLQACSEGCPSALLDQELVKLAAENEEFQCSLGKSLLPAGLCFKITDVSALKGIEII